MRYCILACALVGSMDVQALHTVVQQADARKCNPTEFQDFSQGLSTWKEHGQEKAYGELKQCENGVCDDGILARRLAEWLFKPEGQACGAEILSAFEQCDDNKYENLKAFKDIKDYAALWETIEIVIGSPDNRLYPNHLEKYSKDAEEMNRVLVLVIGPLKKIAPAAQ